jgi:hypothetical protein
MNTEEREVDDVGEAIREGRPLHPARAYRIQFAQGDLDFRPLDISDPVPLGRQILSAAGLNSAADYSLPWLRYPCRRNPLDSVRGLRSRTGSEAIGGSKRIGRRTGLSAHRAGVWLLLARIPG